MVPHPVDIHVGKRLRARRTILGMSQEDIGDSVGITFQQVQKYERGLNRIGSSRLYEFSCLLGVGISYFFEDLDESNSRKNSSLADGDFLFEHEKFNNKELMALVKAYQSIADIKLRKKVLSLVKAIAASESDSKKNEDTKSDLKEEKQESCVTA
ncbi:MAG: helix-turn-helix transcriptional regulator [Rickettsiales bacterium]|nr:helix-turn-helix transcriptional regulator [Pseudomonadota bacterium]MDA0966179.1 helix-turn-helix transcriptional regulator [Pseudomonadota bacterium]MDG4543156.1 helix-turn-helix transcriptional regulator [Rickettsiales bacterium]MDG4545354.1 helix-turn-helix transcriptional regulator [Rickettsiales bacterium]MDG4547803.1 helix-turn-helix transcriptional regulator [Rickettsiales bacterium]